MIEHKIFLRKKYGDYLSIKEVKDENITGKYRIDKEGNIEVQVLFKKSLFDFIISLEKYWYSWEKDEDFIIKSCDWDEYDCKDNI